MKPTSRKKFERQMRKAGWRRDRDRAKGSHEFWTNGTYSLTVPQAGKKDIAAYCILEARLYGVNL